MNEGSIAYALANKVHGYQSCAQKIAASKQHPFISNEREVVITLRQLLHLPFPSPEKTAAVEVLSEMLCDLADNKEYQGLIASEVIEAIVIFGLDCPILMLQHWRRIKAIALLRKETQSASLLTLKKKVENILSKLRIPQSVIHRMHWTLSFEQQMIRRFQAAKTNIQMLLIGISQEQHRLQKQLLSIESFPACDWQARLYGYALKDHGDDYDPELQHIAMRLLLHSCKLNMESREHLIMNSEDSESVHIRSMAAHGLCQIMDAGYKMRILEPMLEHDDAEVRDAAVCAARRVFTEKEVKSAFTETFRELLESAILSDEIEGKTSNRPLNCFQILPTKSVIQAAVNRCVQIIDPSSGSSASNVIAHLAQLMGHMDSSQIDLLRQTARSHINALASTGDTNGIIEDLRQVETMLSKA